jgi:NAD+ diphosphatase
MLGCHARALSRDIVMDETELEDARWFTRAQVEQALEAREYGEDGEAFSAPGKHAVAWHLMDRWARGV